MAALAHEEYSPDPVPPYEPEYRQPADLSWLDNYRLPCHITHRVPRQEFKPLLQFPIKRSDAPGVLTRAFQEYSGEAYSGPDAPAPHLRLVRDGLGYATKYDARAQLAYHTRGLEEACAILEDDPGVGSWDVSATLQRVRTLYRKFRRRERGEI